MVKNYERISWLYQIHVSYVGLAAEISVARVEYCIPKEKELVVYL